VSTPSSRHNGYRVPLADAPTTPRHHLHPNQPSSEISHPRLLTRPEEERRCIDLFWEAYFPSGRPIPMSSSRSYTCTWTVTARELYQGNDSLRHALWANCLFVTGKRHDATWMLKEGSRLYGKALAELGQSLGVLRGARRDALIATVKLLTMFEVWARYETTKDWLLISHVYRPSFNRALDILAINLTTGIILASLRYSRLELQRHI